MLDNASHEFIRKIWGASPAPIDSWRFAKKAGIIVMETKLPHRVCAVLVCKINVTPRIHITPDGDERSKKNHCAVATGFFFLNKIMQNENYQHICFCHAPVKTMEEKIAHRFAEILTRYATNPAVQDVRKTDHKKLSF